MPFETTVDDVIRACRRAPLWKPQAASTEDAPADASIEALIPHRPPLLLLDGIVAVDRQQRAIEARRRLDAGDAVFAGHFPGRPVYPGVLQVEMMGQAGLLLCALEAPPEGRPVDARAVAITGASFLTELRPDDELRVSARIVESDSFTATIVGQIRREDAVCSVASMEIYLAA